MKRQQILIKSHHKIDGKFSIWRCLDPNPVCHKMLDPDSIPDLVCPKMSDPDPVNIRPGPKPLGFYLCFSSIN